MSEPFNFVAPVERPVCLCGHSWSAHRFPVRVTFLDGSGSEVAASGCVTGGCGCQKFFADPESPDSV